MDLLNIVKNNFNNATDYVKCKNFYFENHQCENTNEVIKIDFDYKIMNQKSEEIIVYGYCDKCKKIFYNVDYD